MNKVTINGKDYAVAYNFNALQTLCEIKKCSFADLTNLFVGEALMPCDMVAIAFVGLSEGARREKQDFDLTIDDVDDLLFQNMSLIGEIMKSFQNQTSAPKNLKASRKGAKAIKPKK